MGDDDASEARPRVGTKMRGKAYLQEILDVNKDMAGNGVFVITFLRRDYISQRHNSTASYRAIFSQSLILHNK